MKSELKRLDGQVAALVCRYESTGEFEASPLVPTPECLGEVSAESAALRRRVEHRLQEAADPGETVLLIHLGELLEVLESRILRDQANPHRFIEPTAGKAQAILEFDSRSDDEKIALLVRLFEGVPPVLAEVCRLAAGVPEARRQMVLDALNRLGAYLDGVKLKLEGRLPSAPGAARRRMASCTDGARTAVADAMTRMKAAPLAAPGELAEGFSYRDTLRLIFGIDVEDLLGWYRDEVEHCAITFKTLARALDPLRSPFEILEQDLGPYDDPAAMFAALRHYTNVARERALEHITLPEGEQCDIWQVPEYLGDSYPWGGYFSRGNPFLRQLRGAVFLNQHNYRSITRGWVQLNAIHECYPGHHAHYVKTVAADSPQSFKAGTTLMSRGAPLSEALAMRTETLLQDAFGEPAFPLFVAYRRLHTAVRIWADLALHHFGSGAEAAVDLYAKYLGFTTPVARGQVYAQELSPGYFTVYYYGLKRITELENACRWPERDFSETVFSCGKVSMGVVSRLLALGETDRDSLLQRFSSVSGGTPGDNPRRR